MKLWTDFGVRALIATICCLGFYFVLTFMLIKQYQVNDILAIAGIAVTPVTAVIAFYFAGKFLTNESPKE